MRTNLLVAFLVAMTGCTHSSSVGDGPLEDAGEPGDRRVVDDASQIDRVLDAGTDSGRRTPDASQIDVERDAGGGGERVTLRITPFGEGQLGAGRLSIGWFQLNDDLTSGPEDEPVSWELAYDVPFDPDSQEVTISLAEITLPSEDVMLCERESLDCNVDRCPCIGESRQAVADVIVVEDQNGNGVTDEGDRYRGHAFMMIGYSTEELAAEEDDLFPEGTRRGVAPYRILQGHNDEIFDALGLPEPGTIFDLHVCTETTEDADCLPPNMNLT